jgi:hypothetical protein
MIEKKSDEEIVSNLFYNSNVFAKLSDESSNLYKKSGQEIYEMLQVELSK